MKHKNSVIISAIYHPKPGYEDQFVERWTQLIHTLATQMGASQVGLYHNEHTEEYLATAQWPSIAGAEEFLDSEELRDKSKELNDFCLIPCSREIFDILKEAA